MPNADAHRNLQVEDWLDNHGVQWEYVPALPISQIDVEKSLQNQARVYSQLDKDRVGAYAEAPTTSASCAPSGRPLRSSKQRPATVLTDEGFKEAAALTFRANLGAEEVFEPHAPRWAVILHERA